MPSIFTPSKSSKLGKSIAWSKRPMKDQVVHHLLHVVQRGGVEIARWRNEGDGLFPCTQEALP